MPKQEDGVGGACGDRNGSVRARRAEAPVTIASAVLMSGTREVTILHAGEHHRLRVTANNKLILTK